MPKYVDEDKTDALLDLQDNPDKRVLVIDDVRIFKFPVTHYARTPDEAIKAIRDNGPWDAVMFDHDLGRANDENITIYPVLMFILEAAFYGAPFQLGTCFIHTDNPVGRETLNQLSKHYKVIHIDPAPMIEKILPH